MQPALETVLQTLRDRQPELRALGIRHAAVFGSVARGENRSDSDIDVLVDLDRDHPMGMFEYSRIKLHIAGLIGESTDIVNRSTLKALLRDNILHGAVHAF
jgi:hypothetical protein